MRISISTNIDKVLPRFSGFSNQFRFAVAKALTDTAKETATQLQGSLSTIFDRPTPFTKRAFFTQRATKANLTSVVGIKDIQANYLGLQIKGGRRLPTKSLLRLRTGAPLNKYGNMPKGYVSRLVDKASVKKTGKSTSYFYGKPRGSKQLPVGIYKRDRRKQQLKSLVAFPSGSFQYKARFDFFGRTRRIVRSVIDKNLIAAWNYAKATAR